MDVTEAETEELGQGSYGHEKSWNLKMHFPGLKKSWILGKMAEVLEKSWNFFIWFKYYFVPFENWKHALCSRVKICPKRLGSQHFLVIENTSIRIYGNHLTMVTNSSDLVQSNAPFELILLLE